MKWCFLVSDTSFLMEFFGKLAYRFVEQGDQCLVVFTSKIAEQAKRKYFPKQATFISKVDWSKKYFDPSKREFGELSWRDFYPSFDRIEQPKLNYEAVLERALQEHQFFTFIFETEKPDAVASEPPVAIINEVAFSLAGKYNIPFLGFLESRFDKRIDVYDLEWTDSRYAQTFEQLRETDVSKEERAFAKKYFEQFFSHREIFSFIKYEKIYFSQISLIRHYLKRVRETGGPLVRYLWNRRKFQRYDYESEVALRDRFGAPWKAEKRWLRILLQKGMFSSVDEKDEFFLFPLHVQPETTTSVFAMYYSDQLTTIRNIAFTLPFPCKLYVKEHPSAVGTHPDSFYKKLKEIPNVVLIGPQENVQNLIQRSLGVVVLTSTVGMESALAGKPTYVLGNAFYFYHPMCRKVRNFDELREAIRKDLDRKPDLSALEATNLRFIASYLRNTLEGSIFAAVSVDDENNYRELAKQISNRVKLISV